MPSVCFYFQVHQPFRIKKYKYFDIGKDHNYFNENGDNDLNNEKIFKKVARKSYLPTNAVFLDLLKRYPDFKLTFSFSGTVLDQMERYSPETVESFKRLINTGKVEILAETYYHSLAFLYSEKEFEAQVKLHENKIRKLFGYKPKNFRATELAYSNDLAYKVAKMGYEGILGEGVDNTLVWRSPNFLYKPVGSNITLFLKNYKLSDDIAFRFSSSKWKEYPLTASKFAQWISAINGSGEVINLFMDYETFGEHQWEATGIFDFLKILPKEILRHPDNNFLTLAEANQYYKKRGELDVPFFTSWADSERDLSAWTGNLMQQDLLRKIYSLEKEVLASDDNKLIDDWRKLQTSDHFYYMSTKAFCDGTVHNYFSPYESPYEAFISYVNVLNDFKLRIKNKKIQYEKTNTKS